MTKKPYKWKRDTFTVLAKGQRKTVEGYVLNNIIGVDKRDDNFWIATDLATGLLISSDDKKSPLQRLIERTIDGLGGFWEDASEDVRWAALQEARYGR